MSAEDPVLEHNALVGGKATPPFWNLRRARRVARGEVSRTRMYKVKGIRSMPKVLVVDDDPDLVAICSLVLESEGYAVDAALNGLAAVDKVSKEGADVMLLDVMMPVLDGLSVCKMVKRDPRTAEVPVIIMSASEVLRERGRGCADAVLIKPFDIDILLSTVNNIVTAN